MQFRTEITPDSVPFRISHTSKTLFTGSCFTNNIGRRLEDLRFPVIVNPFGVVYNPLTVKRNIEILLEKKIYTEQDLEYYNELWFSWDHHSSFSDTDKNRVLEHINHNLAEASNLLFQADYLLVTFGTAWVYRLLKTGNIVCNCHKVPTREFSRELICAEEITEAYTSMIHSVRMKNPKIRIIFTISPVRHWKDGSFGNQVSKATLILAVNQILNNFGNITSYFPAYELILDDLRDYRFYADDLVHPNEQAIEYIWEKFSALYFDEETRRVNAEITDLLKAAGHKAWFSNTGLHQKFLETHLMKAQALQKLYPYIDLTPLITHFKSRLP